MDDKAPLREIFLGRQPILGRDQKLIGFELLFRSGHKGGAWVIDDVAATVSVVVNAFSEFGVQKVLGRHKGFVNASADFLLSDMVEALPHDQVVLEVLETVVIDDRIVERCGELKQMGFGLALDDVTAESAELEPLLDLVDVVKLDLPGIEAARLPDLARRLKRRRALLLAEKVETREEFEHCLGLDFDLFQGYHFARPEVLAGRRLDPGRIALLQVLSLVLGDAEIAEIERELKRHPGLTYNLLRLANSAALGMRQNVGSLKHAIVVLGRSQMQRWIQLLLYAAPEGGAGAANPLMQLAATRARFMEYLARVERPGDHAYRDQAFMAGVLSLLDTLFGAPLDNLLPQLNLPPEVEQALLERGGPLGRLLQLALALEADDRDAVAAILGALPGLGPGDLLRAEIDARDWANNIGEATG